MALYLRRLKYLSQRKVFASLSFLICFTSCSDENRVINNVQEGDQFPAMTLAEVDGPSRLVGSPGSRVQVINFWANWCEPCRREMPSLERLSKSLDPEKYSVIGVTVDEDRFLALEFLLKHEITFVNYHDEDMRLAAGKLEINAFPETFVISPDGKIQNRILGEKSWDSDHFYQLVKKAYYAK